MPITAIIPDWQQKSFRCHFCGRTESVKYITTILVIDSIPYETRKEEAHTCNRCTLTMIGEYLNE